MHDLNGFTKVTLTYKTDLLRMYTCKDTRKYKFKNAQSTTAMQAHNFNETSESLIGSPLGPKSMVSVMRKENELVLVKSEALLVNTHHSFKRSIDSLYCAITFWDSGHLLLSLFIKLCRTAKCLKNGKLCDKEGVEWQ